MIGARTSSFYIVRLTHDKTSRPCWALPACAPFFLPSVGDHPDTETKTAMLFLPVY